jgi:hypothetical protein
MVRYRGLNITVVVSHRWQICSTPEGSWTLSSVAARFHNKRRRPMRRVAMQLTLALLEPPSPTPSSPSRELRDAEARAEALKILARLIGQARQPAPEATDE